jgi:hypothetical protein
MKRQELTRQALKYCPVGSRRSGSQDHIGLKMQWDWLRSDTFPRKMQKIARDGNLAREILKGQRRLKRKTNFSNISDNTNSDSVDYKTVTSATISQVILTLSLCLPFLISCNVILGSEVLASVTVKNTAFLCVTLCSEIDTYKWFGGIFCLLLLFRNLYSAEKKSYSRETMPSRVYLFSLSCVTIAGRSLPRVLFFDIEDTSNKFLRNFETYLPNEKM